MRTRVITLTEDLLEETVGNSLCLVSGMPGSGKDYVADKILSKFGTIFRLDDLGYEKDGLFLVDTTKLREIAQGKGGIYYVGISDNLREVFTTLCDIYPNVTPKLLWISPRPDLFRRANLLKKQLAPAGVLASWKKIWEKRSKMSDAAIEKLGSSEIEFFASRVGLQEVFVFRNENVTSVSDITEGWHRWDTDSAKFPEAVKYQVLGVFSSEDYSSVRVTFDLSEPWNQYFCAVTLARDTNTHSLYFWTNSYAEEVASWSTNVSLDAPAYAKLRDIAIRRATTKFERFLYALNSDNAPEAGHGQQSSKPSKSQSHGN